MWHFDLLVSEFSHLELRFQCIIIDGVTETARGLMNFVKKSVLKTSTEFNLYCYYHGGLDWIEIIKIIIATGYLEHPYLANEEHLCNACGLVLAKTDSIVNFREAIQRGTFQWPQEYWEIYCKGELADLLNPYRSTAMRFCLNHMVLDAMQHVMDVFSLLSRIEDQKVFKLLAVPQVFWIDGI
jgi:farnesyl-diphosphate farnesyltransferase